MTPLGYAVSPLIGGMAEGQEGQLSISSTTVTKFMN